MKEYEIIKFFVKEKCRNTGTKQKYWAAKCGYNEQTFSYILNGNKKIYYSDIVELCKGLECQPNDLIKIETDKKRA